MTRYKLIASDLDGTLLNTREEVSTENLAAIKDLAEQGIFFVPATGRASAEVAAVLRESPYIRYLICSNGAVIWDKETDERIYTSIGKPLAAEIFEIIRPYEAHISIRYNGRCHVDAKEQTDEAFEYYNVFLPHRRVIRDFGVLAEDFENYRYTLEPIEVISLFFHDDDELEECRARLLATNQLLVVEGSDHNLEIFHKEAGKGNALKCLAERLGIDLKETISVGDSGNDIPITKVAGLGLAVENASAPLKAVADEVICTNDQHAIRYIKEHYFDAK